MTEFEVALDFLKSYVEASVAAAEEGESLNDRQEFHRHCDSLGVEATGERLELVRDMAGALKECLADESNEDRMYVIPASKLAEGLERYGWRIAFLNKDVMT